MVDDLPGALGTAAEGSLYARAIEDERDGGGRVTVSGGHFAEGECLNCGTSLIGSHCHSCGQQAHLHRTLGAFMHDLLHGALHFEGKMWSTLPLLVLKPGQLTRRYVEGERKKFVSPMALFLFGVFLMFAVFQMVGLTTPTSFDDTDNDFVVGMREGFKDQPAPGSPPTGSAEPTEQSPQSPTLADAVAEARREEDELRARLEEMAPDDPGREELEVEIAGTHQAIEIMEGTASLIPSKNNSAVFTPTGETGVAFLDKMNDKWRENPGLMLYKLQANSYKFSWLLIPLSIPFVWILFAWKRRFKAYDHAIFITYSLSFVTLLFVVLSLFTLIPSLGWVALTAMLFVPPIHLYKQLRGAYSLSRFSAFWRLMALSLFIWIVIILFLQILVLLGAL